MQKETQEQPKIEALENASNKDIMIGLYLVMQKLEDIESKVYRIINAESRILDTTSAE